MQKAREPPTRGVWGCRHRVKGQPEQNSSSEGETWDLQSQFAPCLQLSLWLSHSGLLSWPGAVVFCVILFCVTSSFYCWKGLYSALMRALIKHSPPPFVLHCLQGGNIYYEHHFTQTSCPATIPQFMKPPTCFLLTTPESQKTKRKECPSLPELPFQARVSYQLAVWPWATYSLGLKFIIDEIKEFGKSLQRPFHGNPL